MKNRLTRIKSPVRKKNTEHIPLQVYNTEHNTPKYPPNVNVADQILPSKLKLEIRVSVRISWKIFNANRFLFGFLQINIRYTRHGNSILGNITRLSIFCFFVHI